MSFRFGPSEEDEGLGPPPGPFRFRQRPRFQLPGGVLRWGVPLVLLILIFIVASIVKGIYADLLWFDSVEYRSVYELRIVTRIWLFFVGAGIFLLFFGANVLIALRASSQGGTGTPAAPGAEPAAPGAEPAATRRVVLGVTMAAALFLAVIFGVQAATQWDSILLYMNSQPFGVEDPAFNTDVGFYVFQLPALNFIQGWSLAVVVLSVIVVGGLYAFRMLLGAFAVAAPRLARAHISLLLVVALGLFIWRYWLSRYALVYSDRGAAFGAGYTDLNAQLPVIYILMALASVTAVCILISIFRRRLLFLPIGATVLWVVAAIVGGLIYPASVQQFQVEPNELAQERQYIERNIEATRIAYGLDRIVEQPFPARNEGVTAEEIANNPETIQNIRLWDHRPLLDTLNQIQALRPLYSFLNVDVDRYEIDGELRQVMLAARELNPDQLPEDAKGWVNSRLQFTHGFGLAVVPVNEVVREGLPDFFVKDISPTGSLEFVGSEQETIDQPRIYYGEAAENYVIVNSDEDEFDFPIGDDQREQNRFDGGGGVKVDSFLRRLVYAWEFADRNILLSGAISDESRVLYRRTIRERIEVIAPFLNLDRDPYLVVADGKLFWIQDAYTHTDRYPYATRLGELNYIRNSVKVVVNAFDGATTFYLVEPDDPIVKVYNSIYPDLLTPFEEMPESLRSHLRYPLDLFEVQSLLYATYHLTDAGVFFNREGVWDIPTEIVEEGREQVMEPYYVIMKLPGEEEEEFVLIRPFRLANRPNTIAWLAARSDEPNYGNLLAIRFPDDRLVYGPFQVENRIDADTAISEQLTLWDQAGSSVIRGNLLMIPIGEGNLFVEPIYLQAQAGRLPELKRVIVANGNYIAMEETLREALEVVLGLAAPTTPTGDGAPSPTPAVTPAPGGTVAPTSTPAPTATPPSADDVAALIQQANASFVRAQQLLQQGDFAGYGDEIARLGQILQTLAELTELGQ